MDFPKVIDSHNEVIDGKECTVTTFQWQMPPPTDEELTQYIKAAEQAIVESLSNFPIARVRVRYNPRRCIRNHQCDICPLRRHT